MCGWGGNGWMWNGGWGWVGTAVVFTLFFAMLITATVLVVRYLSGAHRDADTAPRTPAAEDILGGRLARGEIDDDEYRRRMTALREHR
ncbi:SHOCT domain-containing protein [Mycolicibacterium sp. HS_4_1]